MFAFSRSFVYLLKKYFVREKIGNPFIYLNLKRIFAIRTIESKIIVDNITIKTQKL